MPQQFVQNPLDQFEPEKLPIGWPWRLFLVTLIIFAFSVLSYIGLAFGYGPYLSSQIESKRTELSQLAISQEDRRILGHASSLLANLENILDNHILSSKLFPVLERVTNQRVYYTNANLKVPQRELELRGFAESFEVLAQQLEAYDQAVEVEGFTLNEAQFSQNLVSFRISLKLSANLLK